MSSEHAAELPEDLREWVEHRAAETDRDPADVLTEAITAYQIFEGKGETLESNGAADAAIALPEESELDEHLESLEDRIAALESIDERVSAVESEVDEKIEDVRERVIQVKREADAKAPADHDHERLHRRLQRALRAAEEANAMGKQLSRRIDRDSQRVDRGFENFEEILDYLTDTTDELEAKIDALARTVIELRESVGTLQETASAREAAAELKAEANREGVTVAKCEECTSSVQIGLLSTPHCPHCETIFREVDPSTELFGSSYLRTGGRPALQSGESNSPDTPEDLFDEYESTEGQR